MKCCGGMDGPFIDIKAFSPIQLSIVIAIIITIVVILTSPEATLPIPAG